MFSRAATNPMDDTVAKATDENLTTENWERILAVCDKVDADPQDGPRHTVAAVQKRLSHRNANVQLYALSLAEALSKNCGTKVHRELASRAFTQTLSGLVNDRNTHPKVKARTAELVKQWSDDFAHDPSLGIMADTLREMQAQGVRIQAPSKPQKKEISDQDRRREEEELQMALAMSLTETHISSGSGGGGSGSGSGSTANQRNQMDDGPNAYTAPAQARNAAYTLPTLSTQQPSTSAASTSAAAEQQQQAQQFQQMPVAERTAATVSRVRALYDFAASEPGELTFHRGDVISVIESAYKDWWRGSLRGTVGIFPTNYVENLPEPTPAELQREAEEERRIFAEAKNVEKLLSILSSADVRDPAIAENDALQNLYHTTIAIRPKLVRLIEKYSQRKDDLILLNEKFVKARKDYDELMEASLARYNTSGYRAPPPGQDPRYGSGGRGPSGPGGYAPSPAGMQAQHSGPYQQQPQRQHQPQMRDDPVGQAYQMTPHQQSAYRPHEQRPAMTHAGSQGSMNGLPSSQSGHASHGYSQQQQQQQQPMQVPQQYASAPGIFTTRSDPYQAPQQSSSAAAVSQTPYPLEAPVHARHHPQPQQQQQQQPTPLAPTSPSQALSQAFAVPAQHTGASTHQQQAHDRQQEEATARYEQEGGPPISYYTSAPEASLVIAAEDDDEHDDHDEEGGGGDSPVDAYGAVQHHARQSQASLKQQGTGPTATNPWTEQQAPGTSPGGFYDGLAAPSGVPGHVQGPSNPEDYYK